MTTHLSPSSDTSSATTRDVLLVFKAVDRFRCQRSVPTAAEVDEAASRLGRNAYPALLFDLWLDGLLSPAAAASCVPAAWSAAEMPARALDDADWAELFDFAGYTVDGAPAGRPVAPLTLWRGAPAEHRAGWSWTEDRDLALWFARRVKDGSLWTAVVPPEALLARITTQRPGENEYVVDTFGLAISEEPRQ